MKCTPAALFVCLLLATPAWAGFDEEKAAYFWGDYVTAMRELRPVAQQGDAKAQFRLGLMYDHGRGVPADTAEALRWYRMAAEQGLAAAQNKLGFLYAEGKGVRRDYIEAVKWYRRAAEQGDVIGRAHLIRMRFKAVVQKAELRSARSAFDKGKAAHKRGDYATVLREWRPLAEHGHARAQNSLGVMYEHGQGVPKDNIEARKWFVLAGTLGNEDAHKNLGKVDREMTPMQIDKAQKLAREWLAAFRKRKKK